MPARQPNHGARPVHSLISWEQASRLIARRWPNGGPGRESPPSSWPSISPRLASPLR